MIQTYNNTTPVNPGGSGIVITDSLGTVQGDTK